MAMNGIGPLVRQWVHDRNDARRAARTGEGVTTPPESPAEVTENAGSTTVATAGASTTTTVAKDPSADTATFTPEALARFEAWKARHGVTTTPEPVTTTIVTTDSVDPIFLPAPNATNGEPI